MTSADGPYAILRFKKLNSLDKVRWSSKHTFRQIPTPNADPRRKNQLLVGSGDFVKDVKARIEETGAYVRKNAVWAVEVLIAASPEYFRPDDPHNAGYWLPERAQAFRERGLSWAKARFGKNLVAADYQLDESTPHLTALVVPVDMSERKKGCAVRLNAKALVGDKKKLKAWQTDYASHMAPLGLKRGVEGSKRWHEDIKRVYARLPFLEAEIEAYHADADAASAADAANSDREEAAAKLTAAEHRSAAVERGSAAKLGVIATQRRALEQDRFAVQQERAAAASERHEAEETKKKAFQLEQELKGRLAGLEWERTGLAQQQRAVEAAREQVRTDRYNAADDRKKASEERKAAEAAAEETRREALAETKAARAAADEIKRRADEDREVASLGRRQFPAPSTLRR